MIFDYGRHWFGGLFFWAEVIDIGVNEIISRKI